MSVNLFARVVASLCLMAIAVFCSVQLQTYAELALKGQWLLRVVFGLAGSGCLLGIVMLALPGEREPDPRDQLEVRSR